MMAQQPSFPIPEHMTIPDFKTYDELIAAFEAGTPIRVYRPGGPGLNEQSIRDTSWAIPIEGPFFPGDDVHTMSFFNEDDSASRRDRIVRVKRRRWRTHVDVCDFLMIGIGAQVPGRNPA